METNEGVLGEVSMRRFYFRCDDDEDDEDDDSSNGTSKIVVNLPDLVGVPNG